MLADLGEDLLHQDELVRHEREVPGKFTGAAVAFDVQDGIGKGEKVPQDGIIICIDLLQLAFRLMGLEQDTLLDDLIRRGRGEGQAGLETRLNAGEFVLAGLDDFMVNYGDKIGCFIIGVLLTLSLVFAYVHNYERRRKEEVEEVEER